MQRYAVLALLILAACGDDTQDAHPFALQFSAITDGLGTLGATGDVAATVTDLRFYVSDVRTTDADGTEHDITLATNAFQYGDRLTLIDLTSDTSGEGTERTNAAVTGTARGDVRHLGFSIGVPQDVMRDVIANNTAEGAPSPLAEMYWSWASGYRHFVMNMSLQSGTATGEGFVHIGSRDCGAGGAKALSDREQCTYVNTPRVELDVTSASSTINVDIATVLSGLTMRDEENTLGIACHSAPMQADCGPIFARFGLDMATGNANAQANTVFAPQ